MSRPDPIYMKDAQWLVEKIYAVEVGHRSNTVCLLAYIAMKLGRKLRWDPQAERFINDEEANHWLDYMHREPWTMKAV